MKIVIISSDTPEGCEKQINVLLSKGWELSGPLNVSSAATQYSVYTKYVQMLIKTEI